MHKAPDFTPEEQSDKPQNVMALTVPIWAVWSIVIFFVVGTFYFVTILTSINGKLDSAWSFSDQREWNAQAEYKNKGFTAPDVYDIHTKTRH